MTNAKVVQPLQFADARNSLRHVFIRDLTLSASIGIYGHEKEHRQSIRINVDLAVREGDISAVDDDISNVVCYEEVATRIRRLVDGGHVNLVETLAERIAALCLQDRRVRLARVRVEKMEVFPDVTSVGVEIERVSLLP